MVVITYDPKSLQKRRADIAAKNVPTTLTNVNAAINKIRDSQADPSSCPYDSSLKASDVPNVPYDELPLPRGIDSVANFDVNTLVTSKDMIKLQNGATAYHKKRRGESSWRSLTIRRAIDDAAEALTGIPNDIFGNTPPDSRTVWAIFTKNDRLRGMGILLVVIAGSFAIVDVLGS